MSWCWLNTKKQNGEDSKLENGDWVVAELNNATVMLQLEDGELNVKITGEKPLRVDYQVSLYQDRREKMTNADKIRMMTDDELAMNMMCPNENGLAEIKCDKSDGCNCYECLLEWLQSEAEADCIGQVVWDDETLSFELTNRLSAESYECLDEFSVIGNIFDNPELSEREEK